MDEAIVPVCTADYARQHQLQQNPDNLRIARCCTIARPGAMIPAPMNGLAGRSTLGLICRNRRALASIVQIWR
jgi:hypothetical protein